MCVARFSRESKRFGVQNRTIEGVPIPVYSPAKTIADYLKYRNRIRLDTAIQALQDFVRSRKATTDEI